MAYCWVIWWCYNDSMQPLITPALVTQQEAVASAPSFHDIWFWTVAPGPHAASGAGEERQPGAWGCHGLRQPHSEARRGGRHPVLRAEAAGWLAGRGAGEISGGAEGRWDAPAAESFRSAGMSSQHTVKVVRFQFGILERMVYRMLWLSFAWLWPPPKR